MVGYKAVILIAVCAALGTTIGVTLANWNFVDPDVRLGARVLFGIFGAVIAGFGSKWLFTQRQPSN
jgi:hypothetical protein